MMGLIGLPVRGFRKLMVSLAVLSVSFGITALLCPTANAETTKTVFSPFTGKLDFITALSTNSIKAGSGITVSTTPAGVTITATSGGATNGTVLSSTPGIYAKYSDTTTITGFDLMGGTNTWTAPQLFNSPSQSTFTYGVTMGSVTVSCSGCDWANFTRAADGFLYNIFASSVPGVIGNMAVYSSTSGAMIPGGVPALINSTQTWTANQTYSNIVTLSSGVFIPTGTNPLIDADGRMAFDKTAGQLLVNNVGSESVVGSSTYSFTVTISSGIGWNSKILPVWRAPMSESVTISSITASSLPSGTTVVYQLDERVTGTINTAGSNIFSVSFSSANSTSVTTTSFNDASIAAGAPIVLTTPATNAGVGTPDAMTFTVYYRKNRM